MITYLKRLSGPAALITVVLLLVPSSGRAQIPLPLPTSTPTQTATPKPSPTETPPPPPPPDGGGDPSGGGDDGGDDGGSGGSGGSGGGSGGGSSGGGSTSGRSSGGSGGGGSVSQPGPRSNSSAIQRGIAKWIARPKSPARTTTRLLELLAAVKAEPTPLSVDDLAKGFGRFPVLGYTWYQDDFGAPRYIPYYHPHAGTDLFAAQGTPVTATAKGVIWKWTSGAVNGNALWLRMKSGAYFYYGHLYSFARGIKPGRRVDVGDVIGYVGATGNAVGTPAHVHFEIHPTGTPDYAANPKRHLDAWLAAAERRALGVLGFTPNGARVAGGSPWASFLGSMGDAGAGSSLWAATLSGSALFPMLDMTLEAALESFDVSAMPARGADSSAFASVYDPTNPLGSLLGTGAHAHDE